MKVNVSGGWRLFSALLFSFALLMAADPAASSSAALDDADVEIRINEDKNVILDDEQVSLDELKQYLEDKYEGESPDVRVRYAPDTPMSFVHQLQQLIRRAVPDASISVAPY